ncbi:MAG: site-2 protease family protein [Chlamydiota bacterium]
MITSFLYIILALIALSFLIFIHELGHYWMARRVGMRVETFSIGFGKPIYTWERDGVKWQIGWLFFGGFVKIAGHEPNEERDPYEISDGFFGKSPWDRIKVALAGPVVNIFFAMLLFFALWLMGGREKNFSEFTPKIGWVDTNSDLYTKGVRPGDEIVAYGDHDYQGFKDHIFSPMTASEDTIEVHVNKVDYKAGTKIPEKVDVRVYSHPNSNVEGVKTVGVTQSASYIIYDPPTGQKDDPLIEGAPMFGSGIQFGDRLLWVDGYTVYSLKQLNHILNDDRVLLTISRNGQQILRRVPRVKVLELRLEPDYREELTDWQYDAGLEKIKLRQLYTIPYNLDNENIVESRVNFIDQDGEKEAFPDIAYSGIEQQLEPGDRILAINNQPIEHPSQLIDKIQDRQVNIIVERGGDFSKMIEWDNADAEFDEQVNWSNLDKLASSIGTGQSNEQLGRLVLLKTVTPKKLAEIPLPPEKQAMLESSLQKKRKMIEEIDDPVERANALNMLENQENQLMLGLVLQDRKIQYNPVPTEVFNNILQEMWRTLTALFTGTLNPKWMSGPVGIIDMVHNHSMVSIRESLFWVGLISLNLGILNLLPIPVLDGGTIVFSLYEIVTRRRIHPKTLEKLIIPFALLLIGFLIFLTYNDIMRIFTRLWGG